MIDKIETIAVICFVVFLFLFFVGVVSRMYNSTEPHTNSNVVDGEVFSVKETLHSNLGGYSAILIHNDTGVLYFYDSNDQRECITPLFNPDGTLCTIEGELNENG